MKREDQQRDPQGLLMASLWSPNPLLSVKLPSRAHLNWLIQKTRPETTDSIALFVPTGVSFLFH
jgi:hypothetical protein